MIAAGQPLPIIVKVVGWRLSTVVEMAKRYGSFEGDALRRAVETIGEPTPVPAGPYVSAWSPYRRQPGIENFDVYPRIP
jgi:hypothetical protein